MCGNVAPPNLDYSLAISFEKSWFCPGKGFKKEFMRMYKNTLAGIWTVYVGLCSSWAKHILFWSSSLNTGFSLRSQLTWSLLLGLEWGACAIGPGGLIWRHLCPVWAPAFPLAPPVSSCTGALLIWSEQRSSDLSVLRVFVQLRWH